MSTEFSEYNVTWESNIDGRGPADAARRALARLRADGPDDDSHVLFTVYAGDGAAFEVDLDAATPTGRQVEPAKTPEPVRGTLPVDVNATLVDLRRQAGAWQANAEDTRGAAATLSWGQSIDRMGERDDLAHDIVTDFARLDHAMTNGQLRDVPTDWRPAALTDEQFAAAMADWPELDVLGERNVRHLAGFLGIRAVRYLAQDALKNARRFMADAEGQGSAEQPSYG
ncbi:hypothetical protein ACGFYQ_33765 [Streptomyces sp. NPDC048258]|uniref:hypothetical protein n=1 Tax=Streptomyces sp. NPDC048258 TaxID=3365527 RepID=UPI003716BCAD